MLPRAANTPESFIPERSKNKQKHTAKPEGCNRRPNHAFKMRDLMSCIRICRVKISKRQSEKEVHISKHHYIDISFAKQPLTQNLDCFLSCFVSTSLSTPFHRLQALANLFPKASPRALKARSSRPQSLKQRCKACTSTDTMKKARVIGSFWGIEMDQNWQKHNLG